MIAIGYRLRDERLLRSICKREPNTYAEFITRAQKYMSVDELVKSKKEAREGGTRVSHLHD